MASQKPSFYDTLKSTPVLKGKSAVTYKANDDALKAFTVRLTDLATGKNGAVMPFRHPEFMRQACRKLVEVTGEEHYSVMEAQFAILDTFAIIRNIRLMIKFNLLLISKGKTTFIISDSDKNLLDQIPAFKVRALSLGVDVSGYLDEEYDDKDIDGCNNDFCLTQRETPGQAGDLVTILLDDVGCDHVLLIVRRNAPGMSQVALPGGFKEGKESAVEMCKREGAEETGYVSTGVITKYFELEQVNSRTWDPRPLFAKKGMIVDGLLRFDESVPD